MPMLRQALTLLPRPIKAMLHGIWQAWFQGYATKSYSQEGEDMVLRRVFEGRRKGFYVDVGAHHPARFSNTLHFYRGGWTGINIEPNPDVQRLFGSRRPRDINLQLGIGEIEGRLTYYRFDDPALNSFDERLVQDRLAKTHYKVIGREEVQIRRLGSVLAEFLPPNQVIDFMSVDVEGLDLAVLKSNDWSRFRPQYLLVEVLGVNLMEALHGDVAHFLHENDYIAFARTGNTMIFQDSHT